MSNSKERNYMIYDIGVYKYINLTQYLIAIGLSGNKNGFIWTTK